MLSITVCICTHNPRKDHLARVIDALRQQTLPPDEWELVVIDNASRTSVSKEFDVSWHPQGRHVREDRLGLTAARLRAMRESAAEILVFVDDDNVLAPDYLAIARREMELDERLGACGGKYLPEFEVALPAWLEAGRDLLPCRDLGNRRLVHSFDPDNRATFSCPDFYPWGAGLVVRRNALAKYVSRSEDNPDAMISDRKGTSLTSAGDTDIVLTTLLAGFKVAYVPELSLIHLLPADRLSLDYLSRLHRGASHSMVLVLAEHRLLPAGRGKLSGWGAKLRKWKAYVALRAWRGPIEYIRWCGACGVFDARAELPNHCRAH